ncbi:hypothetical protein KSP40_PGU013079 [Platanthera guangdongensis]|uniref:RRM domain-containing protein n=1 Tax=Platanthera guangdongensis TaxID=2320717 RepID=A0ABR2MWA8_9ASPA
MADAYWRYADPRQQVAVPQAAAAATPTPFKRPRPEFGGAPELVGYYPRDEDNTKHAGAIYASYDPYSQNGMPYAAADPARTISGGRPVDDPRIQVHPSMDSRVMGYGGGRMDAPLPPDASNTLFVEGLPGFREVRLVNKDSKHPGGDTFVLCFVDFIAPSQAAVALDALQGYSLDEHDPEAGRLKLQFARFPGPRSSGGPRHRR